MALTIVYMRFLAILFLSMILHGVASGQGIFNVSLGKTKIKKDSIHFTVGEIIDARHDQKVIGVIQRRVTNRKALAMPVKPGLTEIEDLLKRSGVFEQEKGLAIRVSRFQISEITRRWEEVAKTELSLDLFVKRENKYYYITSTYATVELDGTDVTAYHVDNIVACVQKGLAQLAAKENVAQTKKAFVRTQLENPDLTFWNVSHMPIVTASKYADGFYASYEEFVNNTPSIDIGCRVKVGEMHKVKCGTTEEKVNSIYGYAKEIKFTSFTTRIFISWKRKTWDFIFSAPQNDLREGLPIITKAFCFRNPWAEYRCTVKFTASILPAAESKILQGFRS
jgi:hypothetical protein